MHGSWTFDKEIAIGRQKKHADSVVLKSMLSILDLRASCKRFYSPTVISYPR